MSETRFTHDCGHCTFLARVALQGRTWDLYECLGEVIARYGDRGDEYKAAPAGRDMDGPLGLAEKFRRRAEVPGRSCR